MKLDFWINKIDIDQNAELKKPVAQRSKSYIFLYNLIAKFYKNYNKNK